MDAAVLIVIATYAGLPPSTFTFASQSMARCEEDARRMMAEDARLTAWCRPARADMSGRPRG